MRKIASKNATKKEFAANHSESNNQSSESSTQSTRNKIKPNIGSSDFNYGPKVPDGQKVKVEDQANEKTENLYKEGSMHSYIQNSTLIR